MASEVRSPRPAPPAPLCVRVRVYLYLGATMRWLAGFATPRFVGITMPRLGGVAMGLAVLPFLRLCVVMRQDVGVAMPRLLGEADAVVVE